MATIPQRTPSQRHVSPDQSAATTSSQQRRRSQSRPASTVSEDSQTVLLNSPSAHTAAETSAPQASTQPTTSQPQNEQDVRKCWICFADETEDTPESSRWRDPCPCALVAHEECLLDWIADMEGPTARKRTLGPPQLLCPQCKSEIHLARPHDPLVEVVKAVERLTGKLVIPAALSLGVVTVYHACRLHGIGSINAVFGPEDAWRIMAPTIYQAEPTGETSLAEQVETLGESFVQHWRLYFGLPLITPMLILSRTHFADSILPVLPIVFFATQSESDQPFDVGHWPPSASLTMAVLPYLRGVYNAYYERVWAQHEKKWIKELQPRNGQADTQNEGEGGNQGQQQQADADADADAEAEGVFEIRVDGNLWDDWDDGEDGPAEVADPDAEQQIQDMLNGERGDGAQQAPALDAPPLADNQAPAADGQAGQQQARPPRQRQRGGGAVSIATSGLAEKVLGALLYPSIAGLSGELLKQLLPVSWTTKPVGGARVTSLLQEKWGRSIVGGCLSVVVKDAVMLYVRWKMAQQHRRRRVLDYDRTKGKTAGHR